MLNAYDKIASVYDLLARMVFGGDIQACQCDPLPVTNEPLRILIIGGGTGWILDAIFHRAPNAFVTYLEASAKMIAHAKTRTNDRQNVIFIHSTHEYVDANGEYDIVITNFFIDQFDLPGTLDVAQRAVNSLNPHGVWLISDFVHTGRLWHRMLLFVMYRFFRVFARIQTRRLPPWEDVLAATGSLSLTSEKRYAGGFIASKVFRKIGPGGLR